MIEYYLSIRLMSNIIIPTYLKSENPVYMVYIYFLLQLFGIVTRPLDNIFVVLPHEELIGLYWVFLNSLGRSWSIFGALKE